MPSTREVYLARVADRAARRLCIRCGLRRAVADRESCLGCLDEVADSVRDRNRDRRGSTRASVCTNCGEPGHNRRRHERRAVAPMIGLVSCSAQKLDRPAPARELYCSALFRKSLAYAESRCSKVYVLSAWLGLVELDAVTKPYDRRIASKADREAWGRRVAGHLIDRHGREVEYLILAGRDYADPLATALRTYDGHREDGWHGVRRKLILQPLQGLQVGERLRKLNEWNEWTAAGGAA